MENTTFVKTSDPETAEILKMEKFVLISKENGIYTFLNNGNKLNFNSEDKKLVYTDNMNI